MLGIAGLEQGIDLLASVCMALSIAVRAVQCTHVCNVVWLLVVERHGTCFYLGCHRLAPLHRHTCFRTAAYTQSPHAVVAVGMGPGRNPVSILVWAAVGMQLCSGQCVWLYCRHAHQQGHPVHHSHTEAHAGHCKHWSSNMPVSASK